MTYKMLVRIGFCILVSALVLAAGNPALAVSAKPVPDLEVDVWTNKGGQGLNASGGRYQLGEIPVIFFTVNIGCQTRLALMGPGGTDSWMQPAMYGPVYQRSLGYAEAGDIGQWKVALEAWTTGGEKTAIDTTSFVVVGPAPPPPVSLPVTPPAPPPAPPSQVPPRLSPPQSATAADALTLVKVGPKVATELHALAAMKMADGSLPANLNLDATGDGKVTTEDARLILRWAVKGVG